MDDRPIRIIIIEMLSSGGVVATGGLAIGPKSGKVRVSFEVIIPKQQYQVEGGRCSATMSKRG